MLAPNRVEQELQAAALCGKEGVVPAELEFYERYERSLSPHLKFRDAAEYLAEELVFLAQVERDWRFDEVLSNIYLLSCALLNGADEHLRGPSLRLPSRLAEMRLGRAARFVAERASLKRIGSRRAHVRQWRERWLEAVNDYLSVLVARGPSDFTSLLSSVARLAALLKSPLSSELSRRTVSIPSPFRRLDLTMKDVISLGECYAQSFPDRSQPILLVGLRTSGSYLVPVLRAHLVSRGYEAVSLITLAPSKGPGPHERRELAVYAARGYTAVVVDDPPHTGGAIHIGLEIVSRAGFASRKLLVPTHPARRNLFGTLPADMVVTLSPEHWHKRKLLSPQVVEARLAEYFGARGYEQIRVVQSDAIDALNAGLSNNAASERGTRLKKVFEVQIRDSKGHEETRFVLAKSVGFGWLGYHAFLAGHRLAGFVPPVFGLRDGILYMEWISNNPATPKPDRNERIDTAASYIAARTRFLGLGTKAAGNVEERQKNGPRLLAKALGNAFGRFPINILKQSTLERLLHRYPCPFSTFIDGNMEADEWVVGSHGLFKVDYEHHGLGKEELNVIDPAYDLADTILNWRLSAEEELRLVERYIAESGDVDVEQRLMLHKLLSGLWTMKKAYDRLFEKAPTLDRQQAYHRQFMTAWDFLTVQTAHYCGRKLPRKEAPSWRSPLLVTDIDGVLDRRLLGFPTTTAAGIEALSVLHAHDFSVAINSARSVSEVKAYCDAYSLSGGVAEHGSYIWDAITQRGRQLVNSDVVAQLEILKEHLRRIPGVFLDERHEYSIRAFTYSEKPRGLKKKLLAYVKSGVGDTVLSPVSTLLVRHLMTELRLDLLSYHHTSIDTTFVAKEVNKGTGLVALRDWTLGLDASTIAIGDQEPDLAMFGVASRSFAPANIGCSREAKLIGCQIVRRSYQSGLLEIAQTVTRSRTPSLMGSEAEKGTAPDLLMDVLRAADRSWHKNLLAAIADFVFAKVRCA